MRSKTSDSSISIHLPFHRQRGWWPARSRCGYAGYRFADVGGGFTVWQERHAIIVPKPLVSCLRTLHASAEGPTFQRKPAIKWGVAEESAGARCVRICEYPWMGVVYAAGGGGSVPNQAFHSFPSMAVTPRHQHGMVADNLSFDANQLEPVPCPSHPHSMIRSVSWWGGEGSGSRREKLDKGPLYKVPSLAGEFVLRVKPNPIASWPRVAGRT